MRRPGRAPAGFDRRGFLISAGFVAGGAVVAGSARAQSSRVATTSRAPGPRCSCPRRRHPPRPCPPAPTSAPPGSRRSSRSNADFYRVDTALVAPRVTPSDWKLKITGMVDHPFEISFEELLNRDLIERDITLVCVSNEVGGQYAGNARWLGVPLKALLEEAGVQAGADQLVSRSVDDWTAGSPVELVMDGRDAMVAIGMNGEPLPVEHGFPARLVVPGLYGFTSATKWVTELELTTFDAYDAYWLRRGWAKIAPIKTMARIDTPKGLGKVDRRHRADRWDRLGRAPRHRRRPGQRRRRRMAGRPAGGGPRRRHLAPVDAARGRRPAAATPSPPGPSTAPARSRPTSARPRSPTAPRAGTPSW